MNNTKHSDKELIYRNKVITQPNLLGTHNKLQYYAMIQYE